MDANDDMTNNVSAQMFGALEQLYADALIWWMLNGGILPDVAEMLASSTRDIVEGRKPRNTFKP